MDIMKDRTLYFRKSTLFCLELSESRFKENMHQRGNQGVNLRTGVCWRAFTAISSRTFFRWFWFSSFFGPLRAFGFSRFRFSRFRFFRTAVATAENFCWFITRNVLTYGQVLAGDASPQSPPGHSSDVFDFLPFFFLRPLDLDFLDFDFSSPQSPPLKFLIDL